MHFLLLGASGRTGQHVVSELLSQGHTAVALVRTSGSLTPRPGLTIVTGSPLSKSDIRSALLAAPPYTFCSDPDIEHSPQVRQPSRGSDLTSSLPGRLVRQCLRGSGACRLLSRCSDVDSRCRGFMG